MNWELIYIIATIAILPLMIYGFIAHSNVNSTFNKYAKIPAKSQITAAELAKQLLTKAGINDVDVELIRGTLTDCYDPRHKVIKLSESTYYSTSVSAIGVCAHEVGHAIQHHRKNILFMIRGWVVPVVNLISRMCLPLILLGSILSFAFLIPTVGYYIVIASLVSYGASLLFCIITLPLEIDASKQALEIMRQTGEFSDYEIRAAKDVLHAAAQTYIASFLMSLAYFLRFLSYAMIFSKDR